MRWTRTLGGAMALSAALLVPAAGAVAQVPGQCDFSAEGCTPEQTVPTTTPATTPTTTPTAAPSGGVTTGAPGGGSVAPGTTPSTAEVAGQTESQGGAAQAPAPAAQEASVGGLAFTGADVLMLLILGFGAIGAGLVLLRHGRRSGTA